MPRVRDGETDAGEQSGLLQVGPAREGPLQDWLPDELTPRPSLLGYQAVPASLPPTLGVPGPGTDPAGSDPLPSPGARRLYADPGRPLPLAPCRRNSPRHGREDRAQRARGPRAPEPSLSQPGYRQTHLSAGRLPPASASTELVRGFPGCPRGRHRCGKKA